MKLWDVKKAKEIRSFQRQVRTEWMTFSPDGKTLASPNFQEIDLWDVAGGREEGLLSEHRGSVQLVAFSGDGRTLAAASSWSRYTRDGRISGGEVKFVGRCDRTGTNNE